MSLRVISCLAAAGLVTIGLGLPVLAQGEAATPEEAVTLRQDLMREDGGIMRRASGLAGEEAAAAIGTVLANYERIPSLFPEGSIVGDSEALPVIWENWDAFIAIVDDGRIAAQAAIEAAEVGDAAAYDAALRTLGGTCGQCHQQFRVE